MIFLSVKFVREKKNCYSEAIIKKDVIIQRLISINGRMNTIILNAICTRWTLLSDFGPARIIYLQLLGTPKDYWAQDVYQ